MKKENNNKKIVKQKTQTNKKIKDDKVKNPIKKIVNKNNKDVLVSKKQNKTLENKKKTTSKQSKSKESKPKANNKTEKKTKIKESNRVSVAKKQTKQKNEENTTKEILSIKENTIEKVQKAKLGSKQKEISTKTTVEPKVDEITKTTTKKTESKTNNKALIAKANNQKKNNKKSARKKSKNEKLQDRLKKSLFINLFLVGFLVLYFSGTITKNTNENTYVVNEEETVLTDTKIKKFKKIFNEFQNKAFFPKDYVGQIIFESEIINEPVLQGSTNDVYIRRNYETYEYDICGPVFLDSSCNKKADKNLVLYGHNRSTSVDPDHIMLFSPLHLLEKMENYEENKLIYFVLADKVDIYQVVSVYDVKVGEGEDGNQYLVENEPLYFLNNYTDQEFNTYIKAVQEREKYNTGIEITNEDELLTLQTCYEDSLDKLIVLAKKVDTFSY